MSVQLADHEQEIKQLKQLKEERTEYSEQLKDITEERDKLIEELKQAKKYLADYDKKHPNVAQHRKELEELRATLQVGLCYLKALFQSVGGWQEVFDRSEVKDSLMFSPICIY